MFYVSDVVFKKLGKPYLLFLKQIIPKEVIVNLLFNSLTVFMCVIDVNILHYLIDARSLMYNNSK